MRYASLCDGIGAVHVAWKPLGWKCAWTSEIEPFPIAVVDHHWGLPNVGNMLEITEKQLAEHQSIDLLVGGTPCQSFSVAGLRAGLDDPRGNLALRFAQIAGILRPEWLVWENVPGVLSSGGGRDFGSIIGAMVKLGYGIAWRILDAQFVRVDGYRRAVPQRRRRVFVVGCLGSWQRAAAVLFERASLSGHPAPRREAGKGIAASLTRSLGIGGGDDTKGQANHLIPAACGALSDGAHMGGGRTDRTLEVAESSLCLNAGGMGRCDIETETLIPTGGFFDGPAHSLKADGFDGSEDGTGRGTPIVPVAYAIQERAVSENLENGPQGKGYQPDAAYTIEGRAKVQAVAYTVSSANSCEKQSHARRARTARDLDQTGGFTPQQGGTVICAGFKRGQGADARSDGWEDGLSPTLTSVDSGTQTPPGVQIGMVVRRLTPRECERLQGFPDNYTAITFRKKPAADGPRYRAIGNSMACNVMRWIGTRIEMVNNPPIISQ